MGWEGRGPAKGYIEGLEHRLHDAEVLLLHVLPLVSNAQLEAVVHDTSMGQNANGASIISPPLLNKKIGVDYWEKYPLDSVDSVRRWQLDCSQTQTLDPDPGARHDDDHAREMSNPTWSPMPESESHLQVHSAQQVDMPNMFSQQPGGNPQWEDAGNAPLKPPVISSIQLPVKVPVESSLITEESHRRLFW